MVNDLISQNCPKTTHPKFIVEKPYTNENDIITWHFDHSKGRTVKGINILNAIYNVADVNSTKAFEIITKPIHYCDLETRQVKHCSEVTKNDGNEKC